VARDQRRWRSARTAATIVDAAVEACQRLRVAAASSSAGTKRKPGSTFCQRSTAASR
jgi:hypothetical protein